MAYIPEYYESYINHAYYYVTRGHSDYDTVQHLRALNPNVPDVNLYEVCRAARIGAEVTDFLNQAGPNVTLAAGLQGEGQPRTKVYVRISVTLQVGLNTIQPIIGVENFGWGTLIRTIINPVAARIIHLVAHYGGTLVIDPLTGFPEYEIFGCTYYPQPLTSQ